MTQPQPTPPPLTKREYFASLALQGLLINQYATKRFLEQAQGNYESIPGLMAEGAFRDAGTRRGGDAGREIRQGLRPRLISGDQIKDLVGA
jgi:hypothetical protein